MQKIAAQVGDKKLIKLRLYRQTDSATVLQGRERERGWGRAGQSTHGSVSVKCRVPRMGGGFRGRRGKSSKSCENNLKFNFRQWHTKESRTLQ